MYVFPAPFWLLRFAVPFLALVLVAVPRQSQQGPQQPGGAATDPTGAAPPPPKRTAIGDARTIQPIQRLPQVFSKEKVQALFAAADQDGSDWLSLREIRATLELDRREYQVFDANGDGMVSYSEFEFRMRRLIENGLFLGPVASKPASAPAQPSESAPASKPAVSHIPFVTPYVTPHVTALPDPVVSKANVPKAVAPTGKPKPF